MADFSYKTRTWNLYDPSSKAPFRVSRSGIDSFMKCPKCFYLDKRMGVPQPSGYPFTLNNAVDALLKKEFDTYRVKKLPHPLMEEFGVKAIPYQHVEMENWRDAMRKGVAHFHEATRLNITGGLDDVWEGEDGSLHVVDYKATAKPTEVTLDAPWQDAYKRQVEVYQWLLRRNGFKVSDTAYFVYCNGVLSNDGLHGRLEFKIKIIPHIGSDSWIEKVILDLHHCLNSNEIPNGSSNCDYCSYRMAVGTVGKAYRAKQAKP